MNILSAVILSFLPKRYRQAFTPFEIPSAGSIIGGFLECALAFGLLIHIYNIFMNERLAAKSLILMEKAAEKGGESAVASLGGFALIDFLFRITTIVFAFFVLEGLVRVIAAIAGRETVPTLPLKLLEYTQAQLSAQTTRVTHGYPSPRRSGHRSRGPVPSHRQLPPQGMESPHHDLSRRPAL